MKLAERTFKRKDYILTSKFGYRRIISTPVGNTSAFHSGTDYGTRDEKWAQYPLETGKVTSVYTDAYGAKCVIIDYPRIGKRLYYCHLDSICVKIGQKVNHNTILGYTGKTGRANGIHLHLCLKDIGGKSFLDPEKYDYKTGIFSTTSKNFLGKRGYLKYGDQGDNISKIASFMYKTFPAYTTKLALGNYFGPNLQKSIKTFQKRTGLTQDGCIGPKTLKKLESYGFKY